MNETSAGLGGKCTRTSTAHSIAQQQPELLSRLGLEGEAFVDLACNLLERFGVAVGAPPAMARLCARTQRRFLHGQRIARQRFIAQHLRTASRLVPLLSGPSSASGKLLDFQE